MFMKKPLTIILAVLFIGISVFGICLSLSCENNNEPGVNEEQITVTLDEVIQEAIENKPGPQATYVIDGKVKQIDNRTLFIKRVDNVTVIADIDEDLRVETLDELAEGNITKPMAFRDIVIGDAVKLWVQIMSDGSFEQTRLLVNTP
jgi:hypothetical protein